MTSHDWRHFASTLLLAALLPAIAAADISAPEFNSQPTNVSVIAGQDARFDAAGTDETSSQWQVSSDNGQTWQNLPGAQYTYLVLRAVSLTDSGKQYRRRASNGTEFATSRAATLTVRSSTTRGLALLAGSVGGYGQPVDHLVGSNLRFGQPNWLSIDAAGNVYLGQDGTLFKIDATRRATSLAGHRGMSGLRGGTGSTALFGSFGGSATAPNGDLYLADSGTNAIRKITANGSVTTFAGSGERGSTDGKGGAARFDHPTGVALDANGTLYVADTGNHTLRKITPDGVVTTWAGKPGVPGSSGTTVKDAFFNSPQGIAVGPTGSVYVTDTGNHVVRRITQAGYVAKVAGEYGVPGSSDGVNGAAHFYDPLGIAVNGNGEVFIADSSNNTVRKVVGTTTTTLAGTPGVIGSTNGRSKDAAFHTPVGLSLDPSGNLLVADSMNHTIRKVSMTGLVTTWAGWASHGGFADGTGPEARFNGPWGLTTDSSGNVYVADWANQAIRKVTSTGTVSTFTIGISRLPTGVALDAAGNLLVTESGSCVLRRITPQNVATIIAGEPGDCRYVNGNGTAARFISPQGITVDQYGNIFVSDGPLIRKITPSLAVSRYAGANTQDASRDGTATTARFSQPSGLAVDNSGNVFVADGSAIRKITPAGDVTTLAGVLNQSGGLVNGLGTQARFSDLWGLTIDPSGNLFATDRGSQAIRKITPAGAVTTVLGTHDMATVVLGSNPLVNDLMGIAMIDATHLAIAAENSILVFTLP
jgi:sugar lactone lactonase YvrE